MEAENDTNLLYCSKVVGNHEVSFGETKLHFVENKQWCHKAAGLGFHFVRMNSQRYLLLIATNIQSRFRPNYLPLFSIWRDWFLFTNYVIRLLC